jgi:phage minor structural protein
MAIQLTYKRNQYLNLTPPENLPVTADVAITSILENAQTGWQLGTVSDSLLNNARTFKFEWQSTLYCLNEVAKKFGGFLYFDCYWDETNNKWIKTVSLLDEEVDNGVFFSYDKNLKLVEKEKDSSQLFTRLYCFGENTLSINSIPAEQITHYGVTYDLHPEGQSYIQNFQYFLAQGYTLQECLDNFVYEDRFKDEVYVDAQDLYDDCKKKLEEASMPKLTYYVKIVDLSYLTDYQHEKISIGEIITIKDKELGIDIKARVMRMSINYDEPWNTQLEIANYQQDIEELLKNVIVQNNSMYYDRAVLRGQKLADTVKVDNNNGFTLVSKDTGEILGVYGNFVYDGQSYTGVYVKNGAFIIDGGLTKSQLDTDTQNQINNSVQQNVFYNKVKITSENGIEVFDANNIQRVQLGNYAPDKYGLLLKDVSGNITVLDQDGMLQTWQEGRADNVDNTHPLKLNIYLPPETRSITRAILRFKLEPFRAYETGAASGGGSSQTSEASSITTTDSGGSSTPTTSSGGGTTQTTTSGGSTKVTSSSGGSTTVTSTSDNTEHSHLMFDYRGSYSASASNRSYYVLNTYGYIKIANLETEDTSDVWTYPNTSQHSHKVSIPNHTHTVDIPLHTHTVTIPSHTHTVTIPSHTHGMNHTHNVTIPSHTHTIIYGIYESTVATEITIKINGTDYTSVLGGVFTTDQDNIDISSYLLVGQWNTIELGSSQLGRIDATVFLQVLMGF